MNFYFLGMGLRRFGRIDAVGGAALETEFFSVFVHVPIVPLQSYLVLDWSEEKIPVDLSLKSVVVAYLTTWGSAAALLTGVAAIRLYERPIAWALGAIAALFVALSLLAARWARLGPREEEERVVYALQSGQPFDPAQLPPSHAARLRERLLPLVEDAARRLPIEGYRGVVVGDDAWLDVAVHPHVDDLSFLRAAMTLARVEQASRRGAARLRVSRAHRTIAEKLAARAR